MDITSSNLIEILTVYMDKISRADDNFEIYTIMESFLLKFTDSNAVDIFLYDRKNQKLYRKKKHDTSLLMHEPKGLLGNAFLNQKSKIYNHPVSERYYLSTIDNSNDIQLKCQMIVPIVEEDKILGIIRTSRNIYHKKLYTKNNLSLLNALYTFLVKIIYILSSKKIAKYKDTIDTKMINKQIIETEKSMLSHTHSDLLISFASSIHDIKTPANTLYGFLELLEEQVTDKQLNVFIKNAKESALFINSLTETILDDTKHALSIDRLELKVVNSIKFFSEITNMFSVDMSDKEIDYVIYIDPSIPKKIKIDTNKLKRVLINLIANAYKFTPRGREIKISIQFNTTTQTLKISVKDNGIGISTDTQKEIFNAFKQANESIYEGSGLGLSIAYKYIENLEGKLKVKSKINVGSKFYFSIPVEIVDKTSSYTFFKNINKKILLLTKNKQDSNVENIIKTLIKLGMPKEQIAISSSLENTATHIFCFEDSYTDSIIAKVKNKNMKMILVEKKLFSLARSNDSLLPIMSKNTYYGDSIHSCVYSERKKKVLIVDDNKINITLLRYMLETNYVDIYAVSDGISVLEVLKNAYEQKDPFDIIFLDKHMPLMSGTEVLQKIRHLEKEHDFNPIFAISITGDTHLDEDERLLYNDIVKKPFNKKKVQKSIAIAIDKT